jgi:hypothetical protein
MDPFPYWSSAGPAFSRKVAAMSSRITLHDGRQQRVGQSPAAHRVRPPLAAGLTRRGISSVAQATFNHIVTVDWYYADALERALHGQPANPDVAAFRSEEPFATRKFCRAARGRSRLPG